VNTDKLLYAILVDDDFIHYVFNPTEQLTQKWNNYFETHPDQLPIANEAIKILTSEEQNHQLSTLEMKEMEMEILGKCGLVNYN
jgi:hypothetical protein